MQLIGITGGIGSGKTAVARELAAMGYPVYFTDTEAKRIIVSNPMVRSGVESLFGSEVFDGDTYRTEIVARQVFRHPELLERLNRIVHPAVLFDVKHWTARQQRKHCFVESAILYTSGLAELCNHVVRVEADEALRIQRVLNRDYTHPTEKDIDKVRARMRAQDEEARMAMQADIVIHSSAETVPALLAKDVIRSLTRDDNSHRAEL